MNVRELVKALLDTDLDSEVVQLVPGGPLRGFYTLFSKRGLVVLGTGTYGTDSPGVDSKVRAYKRRRPARKGNFVRAR